MQLLHVISLVDWPKHAMIFLLVLSFTESYYWQHMFQHFFPVLNIFCILAVLAELL